MLSYIHQTDEAVAANPSIEDLLRNRRQPFSGKQQILVNFLVRNYQKVAFKNVQELSKRPRSARPRSCGSPLFADPRRNDDRSLPNPLRA
jgi:hypothetical protein